MRYALFGITAVAAVLIGAAGSARAQQTIFSFEDNEVSFSGTAGSSTAISTTTGVTHGTQALQYNWQGTFVGARSAETTNAGVINAINEALNLRVDLTNILGGGPSGTFSDIFLVIFQGGEQYQTNGVPIPRPPEGSRPVTTAVDLPLTLFGTSNRIPQLNPNGSFIFQITINSVVQNPQSTVILDNVRTVIPEPASALTACAALGGLLVRRRRAA